VRQSVQSGRVSAQTTHFPSAAKGLMRSNSFEELVRRLGETEEWPYIAREVHVRPGRPLESRRPPIEEVFGEASNFVGFLIERKMSRIENVNLGAGHILAVSFTGVLLVLDRGRCREYSL
jgi:hypothetical protein